MKVANKVDNLRAAHVADLASEFTPVDVPMEHRFSFATKYSKKPRAYVSEPGRKYIDTYKYDVDKRSLVKDGTKDLDALIQADALLCDINVLMQRFKSGETDIFDQVSATYFDATEMPTTYAEMHQRIIDAEQVFNSLPPELKERFNNSPIEYFDKFGSEEHEAILRELYPSEFEVIESDVNVKGDVIDESVNVE